MNYTYIIIDDDPESVLKTKAIASEFSELNFLASADNYADGVDLILKHMPRLIFLEIDPIDKNSNLTLQLINGLMMYLKELPKIVITTKKKDFAFDCIKYEVIDYLLKPLLVIDFVKLIHKLNKINTEDEVLLVQNTSIKEKQNLADIGLKNSKKSFILCVKSYGDHRYIDSDEICYFQADNNSTDIHLKNGEMITAFKTLKHFETVLSNPFVRIHNSYIVNRNYISRIHTGNSLCYIKKTTIKLPFSKSYKTNIDFIISEFANENYIET
ncbi:LytR/AlgR family response regulator transcription factor [Flavobacterium taihuense]|uniref:LytTR family DNA-binding domain-containing protein n=1 Tax=Flavobacterium taihuense TaxID=2857508 RepID=A0ABS6XRD5_9FLAO|nr:LytTR family DNA-binding domain-containing protein [Flavobacterium taihuense]MBW4359169.1 LytTR family DNA-binding domain-containing protein [Flavobacterium taihuense]